MSPPRSNPKVRRRMPAGRPGPRRLAGFAAGLLVALWAAFAWGADNVVLHLKSGDRISGTLLSEDTNRVVISTSWIKELAIPLAEIARRETAASATPPPGTPTTAASVTNVVPSATAGTPVAISAPPPKPAPARPKYWKGEVKLGADFLFSAKDQQIFYGRFKLLYERPYEHSPKQFFRNIFDYSVDYGRTEESGSTNEPIVSANRMDASDKTDFDIGQNKLFVYNLAGIGYDDIRRIDLRWEIGPGIGYHLLMRSNLVLNTELGFNYQAQYRADDTTTEKFYYRLAEDFTWKLSPGFTFTEKFEFFPQVENVSEFRFRLECTLSYLFWHNLSLNLGLLDLYDTSPASNVPNNDLQIRSSVGITF